MQELITYDRQWAKSIADNNVEEMSTFMSDEWVIIGTEGGITPKASFLEWISSGDLIHTEMSSESGRVKIYGNTGVITNKGTSSGTYKGEYFSFYEWATSVYIHDGKTWQCVLTMLTPAK